MFSCALAPGGEITGYCQKTIPDVKDRKAHVLENVHTLGNIKITLLMRHIGESIRPTLIIRRYSKFSSYFSKFQCWTH